MVEPMAPNTANRPDRSKDRPTLQAVRDAYYRIYGPWVHVMPPRRAEHSLVATQVARLRSVWRGLRQC